MESVPGHPLFEMTEEIVANVRKSYGLDRKQINESLDAIEQWWKKEEHLVDALPHINREMMERFLILGRGSVERTKDIIDKVLTIRGIAFDYLKDDPRVFLSEMESFISNVLMASLPKCDPVDNTRFYLIRLINEDFEDINLLDFGRMACFILEMRLNYEYLFSDRLIFDFSNIKASILTKINPIILKKIEILFFECYKVRVKGVHVINAPPFINKLLSIFKQILKDKVSRRIFVHRSYEELYQEIPRELLPKEYGGDQMSCTDLAAKWRNYFRTKDAVRILETGSKIVSDESKRTCPRLNEEYLGMPGSFKQLAID